MNPATTTNDAAKPTPGAEDPADLESDPKAISATAAAAAGHWLLVETGGVRLGLPATDVVEVRPASRWLPLPAVPEYVCGLINWRGAPLPVLDLASALGLGSTRPAREVDDDGLADQRVAVVRNGPYTVGVLSERMSGVVEAAAEEIGEQSTLTHGRLRDFSMGELDRKRGMVALLDLTRLLDATRVGGDA
jgi:chemotaxis signal transduction protein